jgi:hypothetical protein
MKKERLIEAACPDCAWRERCKTDAEARAKATEHNASCRDQHRRRASRWTSGD